ncbi:hypothetical protein [Geodermatophilus sp. DSM 44513]|uniref:hypothetical protein n=1 Tax=Geodermatophilus sp. DSM 44513 TaxID=1528104 RepID=UPI0014129539|nr:hypothetical protein [Geodermatophilus sp. DSM 44513]WNV74624.1 hypothetical protein RTG05_16750 [Geodermatophilus sp. DSM 44513]
MSVRNGSAKTDAGQPRGDAVLFGLQQVDRDSTDVASLQQLGPFVHRSLSLGSELPVLAFRRGPRSGQLVSQETLDLQAQLGRQLDVGV